VNLDPPAVRLATIADQPHETREQDQHTLDRVNRLRRDLELFRKHLASTPGPSTSTLARPCRRRDDRMHYPPRQRPLGCGFPEAAHPIVRVPGSLCPADGTLLLSQKMLAGRAQPR
jgi:hypothetical protein